MMRFENVVDAENRLLPLKVLLLASSVDEAAVIVMEPPAESEMPLMVPRAPVRRLVPTEVEATSLPVLSARQPHARPIPPDRPAAGAARRAANRGHV